MHQIAIFDLSPAPKGSISFDRDGNFRTLGGEIQWVNLDNTMQIKRLLPFDYMTKIDELN